MSLTFGVDTGKRRSGDLDKLTLLTLLTYDYRQTASTQPLMA